MRCRYELLAGANLHYPWSVKCGGWKLPFDVCLVSCLEFSSKIAKLTSNNHVISNIPSRSWPQADLLDLCPEKLGFFLVKPTFDDKEVTTVALLQLQRNGLRLSWTSDHYEVTSFPSTWEFQKG